MLDRLAFVLGEAFIALRRNGTMTLAAVGTSAVALFLLGGITYAYLGLHQYAESLTGKFEMMVFLSKDADEVAVRGVAKRIRELPDVKAAYWIPKEARWEKQRREDPVGTAEIANPHDHSFKVVLSDLSRGKDVADAIGAMPEVAPKGVLYMQEEMRLVEDLKGLLQWVGFSLGGLLLLTSGLLIYNAIRLAVLSRRIEIRIMQLVGASRLTIRFPFLVEGVVQGALGGLFAGLLLLSCHLVLMWRLEDFKAIAGLPPFPIVPVTVILCVAGALYGFFCSTFAVRFAAPR